MASEGKSKRKRKKTAEPRDDPDAGGGGDAAGDYLVGQVAKSLLRGGRTPGSRVGRLASLFSPPDAQARPVYVPVPQATAKKRKRHEEEGRACQVQRPLLQERAKKVRVRKLSNSDRTLASRESALASADLEEEIHQKQRQRGKNSPSSVDVPGGGVPDDDHNFDGSQRKKIPLNEEEERLKNERTVFVGNLPLTCNKKKLKSFFKEYGQIESVRFRSLIPAEGTVSKKLAAIKVGFGPQPITQDLYHVFHCMEVPKFVYHSTSSGTLKLFQLWAVLHKDTEATIDRVPGRRKIHPDQKNINAYVVFKDESAATKALKRAAVLVIQCSFYSHFPLIFKHSNGAQIAAGFRIRVDLASETSTRDKRSVFVGNLPYKAEESAVEEHFLDCGQIVAVRIVRDPVTGAGRGFGYVLFENTDAVHLALKLNNSELMGRKLRVMRSVNKEKLKQQNSVSKLKHRANFASKDTGHSKSAFIGEKAVLLKKKKKGQKKSGRTKKPRKQK